MTNKELDLMKLLLNKCEKYNLPMEFIIEILSIIDSNYTLPFGDNIGTYNKIKAGVKHELTSLEDIVQSFTLVNYKDLTKEKGFYKDEDGRFEFLYSQATLIREELKRNLLAFEVEEEE